MKQKEHIESLLREYLSGRSEILFGYLFGSMVDSDAFQDVDVGVFVRDPGSIGNGFDYALRMACELERRCGRRVDVILMNTAPDHLIHSISGGVILVDRDEDARVDFITKSWSRYFDIQPYRRQAVVDMLS